MMPLYVSLIVGYKNPEEGCDSEDDEKNFSTESFEVDDINDDFSFRLWEAAKTAVEELEEKSFVRNQDGAKKLRNLAAATISSEIAIAIAEVNNV